jgi:osomolarity two-component system sensor histidine kinase TcsA
MEMMYENVFRQLPDADILLDSNFYVINVTDKYLASTLKSREELLGKYLFDVFKMDPHLQQMANVVLELLNKVLQTEETDVTGILQFDILNGKGEKQKRFWKAISVPIIGAKGVELIIHRVEDVTESQLYDSAIFFRELVDNISDYAIFTLNEKGYIKTWNKGAQRIKGYAAYEIIGKHFSIFYTPEDIEKRKPEKELQEAMKNGIARDEYFRVKKDGGKFLAKVLIIPLYNDLGQLQGFGKITQDLTWKLEAKQESQKTYEEATRVKSEFLANMSHEIRTPMNGIVSAANLLRETDSYLSVEQKELLDIISQSSKLLLKIVNDILDYSRIENKELQLVDEIFNVHEEMEKMIKTYKVLVDDNVSLVMDIDKNIPTAVYSDRYRFRQIVMNMIDNAVKFTEKGRILFKMELVSSQQTFITVQVSIQDTGIGIDKGDKERLFKPFSQLDTSSKKKFKGTGLGLSICKQLIELMHGTISVESEPGRGTTFTFTIQMKLIAENVQHKKNDTYVLPLIAENASANILVVEDNVINQNVVRRILKRLGYKNIQVANDGVEGVEKYKAGKFDVILMDIQMPNMDGYDATRAIREMNKDIPIIAMTANALQGDAEKCLQAGMNDYIAKPVDFKLLSVILNNHTQLS